ncbi:phage holin, LL-H family [Streptococcus pneumoniae]|nr:phage holin, LL-H family [Streptococcus pneumoniae]
MQQITEIIIAFATSFLTVAVGGIVKAVKDYLLRKGGEKAVIIAEILAKNAMMISEICCICYSPFFVSSSFSSNR